MGVDQSMQTENGGGGKGGSREEREGRKGGREGREEGNSRMEEGTEEEGNVWNVCGPHVVALGSPYKIVCSLVRDYICPQTSVTNLSPPS